MMSQTKLASEALMPEASETKMKTDESKIPLVHRVEYLKQVCRDRKVLHLGCTNWPYTEGALADDCLLHLTLQKVTGELWGLDADQEGIEVLTKRGVKNIVRGDLEHLEDLELDEKFDVIIAGEMIEHLSNPGLFLRGIKRFMRPDTKLVITTINAYGGFRMFYYALRGRGGRIEPVHPDHVSYYSYSTIRHLLSRENLAVGRFLFYDLGPEHRPHNRFYLNWVNDLCMLFAPQLADGIIIEASLA
ncbi:MAG: methyltransferase domain-containing protein [Pyrinomonadaceae bacterium]|nr:methyltransferase domain-containing protein [Pyrinomonadaceae bacterium]